VTSLLVAGAVFGLSGGLSPGPLLALVISESLNHGLWAGVRVAVAPLLSDLPIVGVALLLLSRVTDVDQVLGVIALAGSGFLVYLAVDSLSVTGFDVEPGDSRPRSLLKAVATNLVNPSPYLFWLTIGGPIVMRSSGEGMLAVAAFVVAMYFFLVSSKIGVAFLVARSRQFLRSRAYVWLNRGLGLALLGFALIFAVDGLDYLGVI
jgi:threonine/homoserine/homoserine lactone efflux protein